MKFSPWMLTFVAVLTAAMMAANEFPELLTLTDNVSNDYVTVCTRAESAPQVAIKRPAGQLTAAPVALCPPVGLRLAAASNFLISSTAKSPRSLLLLLVTQRT